MRPFCLLLPALLLAASAHAAEADRHWTLAGTEIALTARTPDTGNYEDRLTFSRGGKAVLEFVDAHVGLNALDTWRDAGAPPFGENLTGGSAPQVVVQTFSGGAHCCFALSLVTLGETVSARALPFDGNYGARFEKGADGVWRLIGGENVFAYWRASFAGSPAPTVVYRLEGETLALDEAAMRKPAPPLAKLLADRDTWDWSAAQAHGFLPYPLLNRTYDLIYTGHLDAARAFLAAAWKPDLPGGAEVAQDLFGCQLRRSEHWPAIATLNRVPADPPHCD